MQPAPEHPNPSAMELSSSMPSARDSRWACEVCFASSTPDARVCSLCGVSVCRPCFAAWLESRVHAGLGAARSLTCVKCRAPVSDAELVSVCGLRTLRKYAYFRSKELHKADEAAAWCPTDGCWRLLLDVRQRLPPSAKTLTCPDCHADICASCFAFHHGAQPCPAPRPRLAHAAAATVWQRLHTKKCPSCAVRIQRAGGCSQMRCANCHVKFCWRCRGVLYGPQHTPHLHTDAGAGDTQERRRTHTCHCPRIAETLVYMSLAGGALIVVPLALAATVVLAPPAMIAFVAMPKEKRARTKAEITAMIKKL